MSSSKKSVRSNSVSKPIAPIIEAPEIISAVMNTMACCDLCKSTNFFDNRGIRIGSAGIVFPDESKTTCNAPTTIVALMNAEITPTANAIPNVWSGGNGETIFARNAATVVITAKPRGVERRAHEANQDSAASSISLLNALYLLCR